MHNYIPVKNVPFFSMLLLCSFFRLIKRIISSEKWFNYIVFFFFWKMTKIWVGQTMLMEKIKEDGLIQFLIVPCNSEV